jgi:Flp pilus assembly protein TadD
MKFATAARPRIVSAWPLAALVCACLLAGAEVAAAQVQPRRNPVTRLPDGTTLYPLAGKVLLHGEGSPVRGAQVVLVSSRGARLGLVVTDDEGAFIFYDVVPGTYSLEVSHSRFGSHTEQVQVTGGDAYQLRIHISGTGAATGGSEPPGLGAAESSAAPESVAVWALQVPREAEKEYRSGLEELGRGRRDRSLRHLQAAVELYPRHAGAWAAIGSIHLRQKELAMAREAYDQALEIDPALPEACFGLASLLLSTREYAEAEALLVRLRGLRPGEWRVGFQLGELYTALGDPERAESALRAARQLAPPDAAGPRLYLLLINSLARQDKLPETLQAMNEFLDRFPDDPFAEQVRQKRRALEAELARPDPAARPRGPAG